MIARIINRARWLYEDEDGATMVEYALLVALIAIVVMGAVTVIGTATKGKLNEAAVSLGGTAAP